MLLGMTDSGVYLQYYMTLNALLLLLTNFYMTKILERH